MLDCDYDTQDKFIMVKFHYRGNVENTHMSDNNVQSYIDLLIYFEPYVEVHIFPVDPKSEACHHGWRFALPCGNTTDTQLKKRLGDELRAICVSSDSLLPYLRLFITVSLFPICDAIKIFISTQSVS